MKISLERNAGDEHVPYTAHIDSSDLTIHTPSQFRVPVQVVYTGTTKFFQAEICGFLAKSNTADGLIPRLENLLYQLINVARLPRHVFIARRAKKIYPVYTVGNEVMATTPGGPLFRHVELAKIREYLTDYLHETNVLGEKGLSDKLHVRGLDMETLGLLRPIFYLKKRVSGENDFWSPVFESQAGDSVYTYAVNARREVAANGREVLVLRDIVAELLKTDGRLYDSYDLRADRLMPAYWQRLQKELKPEGQVTASGQLVDMYSAGKIWLGVEPRPDEDRYGLFFGANADDLRGRITRDFIRRGLVLSN
jgi:hypothetical protein